MLRNMTVTVIPVSPVNNPPVVSISLNTKIKTATNPAIELILIFVKYPCQFTAILNQVVSIGIYLFMNCITISGQISKKFISIRQSLGFSNDSMLARNNRV